MSFHHPVLELSLLKHNWTKISAPPFRQNMRFHTIATYCNSIQSSPTFTVPEFAMERSSKRSDIEKELIQLLDQKDHKYRNQRLQSKQQH